MMKKKDETPDPAKRQPPLSIPLSFDAAVEGLLAVRPNELKKDGDAHAKQPATPKNAKKKKR